MSAAVDFHREAEFATARRYAGHELRGHATPAQTQWLHTHAVPWMEALTAMQLEVETSIGQSRAALRTIAPGQGERASREYLQAKREADAVMVRRQHFLKHVRTRRAEVRSMIGEVAPSPERLVGAIVLALELLDGDEIDGAYDLLASVLERVDGAQRARRRQTA